MSRWISIPHHSLHRAQAQELSVLWEKTILSVAGAKYDGIMKRSFESPIRSPIITKNEVKGDMTREKSHKRDMMY